MSKRKKEKEEDLFGGLGMIDLSAFKKVKNREPICKGCKTKDCEDCVSVRWRDLGYHFEQIMESLSANIGEEVARHLEYLWRDNKEEFGKLMEKQMNKFGINFIREMDMKMRAEE